VKRLILLLVGLVPLCACSPDVERLVAWLGQHQDEAAAAGEPCAEYAGHLAWLGLPEHFLFVMNRESHCQPTAHNPSGASGLLQIMPMWADDCGLTRDQLFDPLANLRCAAVVYSAQGPGAWAQTW
jgi:soluble lytic murein transglycosylase-like protein